jgi:YidC/Oxa1 family membrane protein insertase
VFYGNKYNSRFDLELIKINDLISGGQYDFVWNSGLKFVEENSVDEANYSNASIFYGGEHVVVDAPGGGEKIEKDFNGKVEWLAIKNKYFASIIIPDNANNIDGAFIKGYTQHYENGGLKEFYSARLKVPFKNKDYEKQSFTVFIGPASYDLIKDFGKDLTSIIDFGSFFGLKFIVRPIAEYVFLPLFKFLHSIIPNYGVVIIIFSLIIKVVTHPLTRQSMYSMKKMQLLQPKITEIKARLKDDPQKMNKETMKLYSTYGINPAGGCLPLILQMPIFIALWGMFQSAIELRQQPFLGWINDLSRPDIILTLGFKIPIFGIDQISGLALLMGITTFVQQKMTVKDPQQQMLIYIMPIMLTALFMSFPAGLNLYYFLFNLFSIAQQYYINHTHKDMELVPVKNPKKQGGFLQRMMEAAENKAKQQQVRKKR